MHITIPRAALAQATGLVQRIVERRNTIPILSNLALIAEDGALTIVATDLDIEARTTVQATIVRSGRITVPAHMFADVAGKLPDGLVTIDDGKADGRLVVSAGRSRFQLQTLPFDDFPPMAAEDLPTRFELPKADLERMFGRTQMAVSTEEVRYYLNGVFLHAPPGVDPPVLRAVATDGHRLARLDAPLPAGAAGMPGIIVPRKTVGEVLRLAKSAGDTIAVELSDAKIRMTFGATVVTSKLIDGTFPDYDRVIPKDNANTATFEVAALQSALDRVTTINNERGRAVKLSLTEGLLALSVTNPDSGTAEDELPIESGAHFKPIEIGFNGRYLAELASTSSAAKLHAAFGDPGSPSVWSPLDDPRALYVLMPMRV